ncbi:hypothetical protein NDU88_002894 [Pleurodeles waltl]|uniref:Uncharacterized protein n=1 Tax=Pleurodeles waltl TaxID=8319 RepID=A0AAV7RBA6_PLEWA|nr:hypothetical protein NDU88_002894 [Pleurodeles waltl]
MAPKTIRNYGDKSEGARTTRIGRDKGETVGLSKCLASITGKAVGKNTSGLMKDAKMSDSITPPLEIKMKSKNQSTITAFLAGGELCIGNKDLSAKSTQHIENPLDTQDINRELREKVLGPSGNGQLQIQQVDRSKQWGDQSKEEIISTTGPTVENEGPTNLIESPKKQDKISLLTDWGKDSSDKFYSLTEESDLSSADRSLSESDESESCETGNKSLNCEFTIRQTRQRKSAKSRSGSQECHENAASMSGRTLRWDYTGISLADNPTAGNQGPANDRNESDMGASAGDIGNLANTHVNVTEAGILQSIYNSIKELQTETRIERRRARIATKKLQGSDRKVAKSCMEIEAKLCSMEDRIVAVEEDMDTLKEQSAARDGQMTDVMWKMEDLENRQRRNNLRFLGIPEGLEGNNIQAYMVNLLRGAFPELKEQDWDTQDINRELREKVLGPSGNGQLQIQQVDRSKQWGDQSKEEIISTTGPTVENEGPTNLIESPKKQDKISLLTDWGKDSSDKFYSLTEESDLSSADRSLSESDESESCETGNKSLNCEFTIRQTRQRKSAKSRSGSQECHENAASMSGRTLRWDYTGISLADNPTAGNQGPANDRNESDMGASAGDIGNLANTHVNVTEAGILQSIYNSIKELQTETRIERRRARIATKKLQGSDRKVAKSCMEIEAKLCSMEDRIVAVEEDMDTLKEQSAARDGQMTDVMWKMEDLENRQRRNNLRFLGIPEGLEGNNIQAYMVNLLRGAFPELKERDWDTQDINRELREKVLGPSGNGQLQIQQVDRSKQWGDQSKEEIISTTGPTVENEGPTNLIESPKKQDKISLLTDWGKDSSDKFYSLTEESDLSSADRSLSESDESESCETGNKSLNCEFTIRQTRQRKSAKSRSGSQECHENAASMSGRTLRWDYTGISLADNPTAGNQGPANDRNESDMGASAGDIGNLANTHVNVTEAGILQSIYNSIKELQTETRIERRRARIATKKLQGSDRKVAKSCMEIEAKLCSMEDRIVAVEEHMDTLKEQSAARDGQMTDVMWKMEDLENRQRRNNLRFLGIPEGLEGNNIQAYMVNLLRGAFPELKERDWGNELQRVHRGQP